MAHTGEAVGCLIRRALGKCILSAWEENILNSSSGNTFALCSRMLGLDNSGTTGLYEWTNCHFRHSLEMWNWMLLLWPWTSPWANMAHESLRITGVSRTVGLGFLPGFQRATEAEEIAGQNQSNQIKGPKVDNWLGSLGSRWWKARGHLVSHHQGVHEAQAEAAGSTTYCFQDPVAAICSQSMKMNSCLCYSGVIRLNPWSCLLWF